MNEIFHNNEVHMTTKAHAWVTFFFVSMGVITLTYGFFFLIGFLPEKPNNNVSEEKMAESLPPTISTDEIVADESVAPEGASTVDPLPMSIIFDTLDREVKILNPEDDSIEALDNALLSGVVRHPDSADFAHEGTIFLLGHSSYLPIVHNKNFQAFNGIQKLVWGDTIRLQSNDREYVYSVDRTYQAKAEDAEVAIERGAPKLVLATCNSFGTKDDRFVVEATLVESHLLDS